MKPKQLSKITISGKKPVPVPVPVKTYLEMYTKIVRFDTRKCDFRLADSKSETFRLSPQFTELKNSRLIQFVENTCLGWSLALSKF